MERKLDGNYTRMLRAVLNNTPQIKNCTDTYHPSRKLFKLEETDIQDTAGEVRISDILWRILSHGRASVV